VPDRRKSGTERLHRFDIRLAIFFVTIVGCHVRFESGRTLKKNTDVV
jgi:hypothetical protein